MENHVKYLRSCQLINAGVDFIVLAETLGITVLEAVELMVEDHTFNKFFSIKNNLVESES